MTPAVSRAQFRKMALLLKEGKITQSAYDAFNGGVDYKKLPAKKKKPAKRKR